MKSYYFLLIVCLAFLFQSCGKEHEPPGSEPAGEERDLIQLSGSGVETIPDVKSTRAASDFPNSRQIGVVAAQYNVPVDWTSYNDINNATAVTNREQGGTFYFNFSPVKYWPFDGSNLVFLGYSPPASATNGITLETSRTVLDIALTTNTPDVMYASNNTSAATTPYSKTNNPTVNLGQFRHALSLLTIEVVADPTMNPDVRLSGLIVRTNSSTATLDLLAGASGLTVNQDAGPSFEYQLVSSNTDFRGTTGYVRQVIVLPGSHPYTEVEALFSDGYFTGGGIYQVSNFTNADNSGNPVTFRQGYNTTLTFTVTGTLVEHPEDAINLQGQLTDWDIRDELGVTIN